MTAEPRIGLLFTAARTIRWLALPIVVIWAALTVVVNIAVPQLSEIARARSR
ncbi:hypothetical protein [Mycobacterium sp. 050134]|uniref:hypothetical protein n=1 Tax=Mycobacterium sp. 050134 TaxID=3096111 RepID=UPI002ED79AB3